MSMLTVWMSVMTSIEIDIVLRTPMSNVVIKRHGWYGDYIDMVIPCVNNGEFGMLLEQSYYAKIGCWWTQVLKSVGSRSCGNRWYAQRKLKLCRMFANTWCHHFQRIWPATTNGFKQSSRLTMRGIWHRSPVVGKHLLCKSQRGYNSGNQRQLWEGPRRSC